MRRRREPSFQRWDGDLGRERKAQGVEHLVRLQPRARVTDSTAETKPRGRRNGEGASEAQRCATAAGEGTTSRGTNRAAGRRGPDGEQSPLGVRPETQRTPGSAAGCNKPATPGRIGATRESELRSDQGRSKSSRWCETTRTKRDLRPERPWTEPMAAMSSGEWTPRSMSMEGRRSCPGGSGNRPRLQQCGEARRQSGLRGYGAQGVAIHPTAHEPWSESRRQRRFMDEALAYNATGQPPKSSSRGVP
jgi:hypothetical protein